MVQKIALIAAAGAAGALARYGLTGLTQRIADRFGGGEFPWATAVVNIVGCFVVGVLWMAAEHRLALSPPARAAIFIGFLGAFTTFSTYVLETGHLMRDAQWWPAVGNIALQNGVGLAALVAGWWVGKSI
jgi:CrcB protein